MTEEQIRSIVADEMQKQLAIGSAKPVMSARSIDNVDEVIETIMLKYPTEWGRRVVKRDNEILLQTTKDKGRTWVDDPIPDFRLLLPPNPIRSYSSATIQTKQTTQGASPYDGLVFEDNNKPIRASMNSRTVEPSITLTPDVKLQMIIDSGKLLNVSEIVNDEGETVEQMTFLGTYSMYGLRPSQVWRDDENYLRIAPDR